MGYGGTFISFPDGTLYFVLGICSGSEPSVRSPRYGALNYSLSRSHPKPLSIIAYSISHSSVLALIKPRSSRYGSKQTKMGFVKLGCGEGQQARNVEHGTWNVERGTWNVERRTWNVELVGGSRLNVGVSLSSWYRVQGIEYTVSYNHARYHSTIWSRM